MDDPDEPIEVAPLYKRAFNDAELVINQFPELLDKIEAPEGEPSEYTKGFQDRVIKYQIERDSIDKNMSREDLSKKYGKALDKYDRDYGHDVPEQEKE